MLKPKLLPSDNDISPTRDFQNSEFKEFTQSRGFEGHEFTKSALKLNEHELFNYDNDFFDEPIKEEDEKLDMSTRNIYVKIMSPNQILNQLVLEREWIAFNEKPIRYGDDLIWS